MRLQGLVDGHVQKYARLHCFYGLIFTKLASSIEQIVGFIMIY